MHKSLYYTAGIILTDWLTCLHGYVSSTCCLAFFYILFASILGSISKEKICVIEIKLATLAVIVTRASANTPLHFQEAILRLSFGVRAT